MTHMYLCCKYILAYCLTGRYLSISFYLLLGPIVNILSMHTFFHRALLRYAKTDVKMPLVINQYLNDYIKMHQHKKSKGYIHKQNDGENWPHYSRTVIFLSNHFQYFHLCFQYKTEKYARCFKGTCNLKQAKSLKEEGPKSFIYTSCMQ